MTDVDYTPFAESLQQPDATATSALLALKVAQATRASDEFRALVASSAEEVRGVLLEEQRQHASMLACHPNLGRVTRVVHAAAPPAATVRGRTFFRARV